MGERRRAGHGVGVRGRKAQLRRAGLADGHAPHHGTDDGQSGGGTNRL